MLISDAKDPAIKPGRKRDLMALMALLQHVAKDPAAYAEPRPLSRAFATVPDMPPSYDVGALIDELARLRLFVVEIRDFDALLVPATSAGAKAERARKPQRKPLSTTVTDDIDAQVRAEAKLHGITVSEMIARSLTERYAANVPVYNTTRGEDGTMTLSAEPTEYMRLPDHLSKV